MKLADSMLIAMAPTLLKTAFENIDHCTKAVNESNNVAQENKQNVIASMVAQQLSALVTVAVNVSVNAETQLQTIREASDDSADTTDE